MFQPAQKKFHQLSRVARIPLPTSGDKPGYSERTDTIPIPLYFYTMEPTKHTKKRKYKDADGTKAVTKPTVTTAADLAPKKKLKRAEPEAQNNPPAVPEVLDEEEEDDDNSESEAVEAETSESTGDQGEESNGDADGTDLDAEVVNGNGGGNELESLVAPTDTAEKFEELKLSERTLRAIKEEMNFETMTPIQRRAIPPLREYF